VRQSFHLNLREQEDLLIIQPGIESLKYGCILSICIPNSYNSPTSYYVLQSFMNNRAVQRMMKSHAPKRTKSQVFLKKNDLNYAKLETQSKVPVRPTERGIGKRIQSEGHRKHLFDKNITRHQLPTRNYYYQSDDCLYLTWNLELRSPLDQCHSRDQAWESAL